ncbi:hypothetical protein [Rhizobium leguminosarum]
MLELDFILDREEEEQFGNFLMCYYGHAHFTISQLMKSEVFIDKITPDVNFLLEHGQETYKEFYRLIMREPSNFRNPGLWALYWALTEATHTIADMVSSGSHEPELNGALIAAAATSVRKFRSSSVDTDSEGVRDCVILNLADMANHGNEGKTGSDFGLIIELRRGDERDYIVTLIQAKRADSRSISVERAAGDSTQLEKLCLFDTGTYLFYNHFTAQANVPPTSKSAILVHQESNGTGLAVDPLRLASDFPAHVALLLTSGSHGSVHCKTPEDALASLFNPEIPEIYVNDLMVCVLDQQALTYREIATIRQSWDALTADARNHFSPPASSTTTTDYKG